MATLWEHLNHRTSWRESLVILVLIALVGGFVWRFSNPHAPPQAETLAAVDEAFLRAGFVSVRLEPDGNSLTAWVGREEFEARIPYPDRGRFLKSTGQLWCESQEDRFWEAFVVADIRTGGRLGKLPYFLNE